MAYGSVNAPGAGGPEFEAVKTLAQTANSNASTAMGDAAQAKADAAAAMANASTALADASTAKANAAAALAAANEAKSDAATAKSDAATALSNASQALSAAQAAQEAVDQVVESGGGGNIIKITFGPEFVGANFSVSDGAGETKTGVVPDTRVANVSVTGCNTTYTIRATAGGIEYSNSITTGAYYGQVQTTLNVFSATINVTAVAGATVNAVCNGNTYSATAGSNGVAAVAVKKAGNYTVSATYNGKTSGSAPVNVVTDGGTYSATVKFKIANVPSQAGSLTYTGNAQSPSWNNYSSEELTLGGTTTGTNATTYSASFTPKAGYEWSDGTTTVKTVNWTIGKAAGSLSLNKTSMALNGSTPTGTITVTRSGDGTITARSSNTAVATVSVSGNTVTVTAISEGSATITVSVGAGTNHNAPSDKTCSVTATDMVHIYGASWDGTSTTAWTRTDDAAGFTDPVPYKAGMTAAQCSSPFDNKMPWSGMVRSTDSAAGELVAIPKFWYKLTQNGNGIKVQIADRAQSGYSVSPAHMDRGDGKGERNTVYVGRYHCHTSNFKSQTGGMPKANVTRSAARDGIKALGSGIWQSDFAMRFTLWLLYIVEFANWNSQEKIGKGCGNNSSAQNMGYTDSMPYHTGTTQSDRNTYGLGTQYRNIEGLWDNVYDWCDGCYYNNNGLNLIKNPANFSDTANGTLAGKPSSGYPSKFSVTSNGGFPIFYPTEASGSETTYSCDYWSFGASNPCLYVGGNYGQVGSHGLFYVYCTAATSAYAGIGCRLQKLP